MKKLIALFVLLSSISTYAQSTGRVIEGVEAKDLFDSLEHAYEYRYGAIVAGMAIETIVRHDLNSISCSKESVQYGEAPASITYNCLVK